MRVTNSMLGGQVLLSLQRVLGKLARQQEQIASGRRILAPSDDPAGIAQSLTVKSRQMLNQQHQKNITEARSILETTDGYLQTTVEAITQVREIAVRGGNDTNGPQERQAIGAQVNQFLEALVELANGKGNDGNYLFGGQESTTAPYSVTRDVLGNITAVTPNPRGIDTAILAEVDDGVTLQVNISGTDIFGPSASPTYAFDVLINLRDNLNADNGNAVRLAPAELDVVLDRATVASTVVGARLNRLDLLEPQKVEASTNLADTLSRIEDLDMAKASIEFQQQQTAYEAALSAGARVIQQTLVDFLR
ncbi:MAG TPA: flagellar hook-associated protein FlgL [Methylomirabilota bacterium]|nr:flagellar hook-associated protein FlgL [Methylomirabilota bacterium]